VLKTLDHLGGPRSPFFLKIRTTKTKSDASIKTRKARQEPPKKKNERTVKPEQKEQRK
jgi:hypothetical protein